MTYVSKTNFLWYKPGDIITESDDKTLKDWESKNYIFNKINTENKSEPVQTIVVEKKKKSIFKKK